MFEWPWTKAARQRREREEINRRARNPYGLATRYVDRDMSDDYMALQYRAIVNAASIQHHHNSAPEPTQDRSGDYGTRDHTGFKTGGGFGGDNSFHTGGGFGGHSTSSSDSSSSDSSSSYSSSDGGSSDGGGGGGGGD